MPIPSPVTASRVSLIRQERARTEHIALVYRLLPSGILATLGVASLLVWGLMDHIPRVWLYGWLAVVILVSAVRVGGLRAWQRSAVPRPLLRIGCGIFTWVPPPRD